MPTFFRRSTALGKRLVFPSFLLTIFLGLFVLAAYAPRTPLPANTVTLPIEVYAPDGRSAHTESVTLNVSDASNIDSLYVKAHQPFYNIGGFEQGPNEGFDTEGAAEIRINGGPWIEVRDENVNCAWPEKVLDCVAGHYATIRFSIPASNAVSGANTIEFKFNGTEGVRSGYRVLGVGFMTPADPTVQDFNATQDGAHDGTTLVYEDFSSWSPPSGYDNSSDINAGEELWNNEGALVDLGDEPIQAACGSCHARDGRDLKYFNYSNRTITARSVAHGLTETQGKQIAAYIRSIDLKKADGSSYEAPGTPWDPPYQPGPELMATGKNPDASDQVYWAAGAGLEWVLDHDRDMMPYIFPKNGDPSQGVDRTAEGDLNWHRIHMDSTLNVRAIPISLQFPDWNRWLPRIHPMDAHPDLYNGGTYEQEYEVDLQNALQATADGWNVNELQKVEREIKQMHLEFRQSGLQNTGRPSGYSDNKYAVERLSRFQHRLVKTWESLHRYHLENGADELYCDDTMAPYCEPRSWMGRQRTLFDIAPHISAVNGLGNPPFTFADASQDNFQSHIWYQLQMVLNPGADPASSGQSPMDWGYQRAFIQSSPVGIGMRVVLSEIKSWQLASNGYGVDGTGGDGYSKLEHDRGWNPFRTEWRLIAQATENSGLWGNLTSDERRDAVEAMLRAWWDFQKRFPISEFPRDYDNRRFNPSDYVPEMNTFTGPKDFGQRIYQTIPSFEAMGVAPGVLDSIATWGQQMWPNTSDPAFTDLVSYDPPSVDILSPSDGATFTAPASFMIEVDASDPDGSVSKINFLADGTKIGGRSVGPQEFVWTNVPEGTYTLTAKATDNDGAVVESDPITITVEAGGSIGDTGSQDIQLDQGWNMISSWIAPSDTKLAQLFDGLLSNITLIKDEVGATYLPSEEIDDIGHWNPLEGMMVYSTSDQVLTVDGRALRTEWTPLPLDQGWNIVPYLAESTQPVEDAFSSIQGQLVLVKDQAGQAYIPEYGINEIGNLEPGQGYKVYVSGSTTLTYPVPSTKASAIPSSKSEADQGSPSSAIILAQGRILNEGDRVTAWSNSDKLIGEGRVRNGLAVLTIAGDEPATSNVEGATPETAITLKVHRTDSDEVFPVTVTSLQDKLSGTTSSSGKLKYKHDGFFDVKVSERPNAFGLTKNFPNPLQTSTSFDYSVAEQVPVKLAIYNVLGQQVAVLVDEPKSPGRYTVTFDASRLSSGVYFYRMRAGDFTKTQKMTIVR